MTLGQVFLSCQSPQAEQAELSILSIDKTINMNLVQGD